MFVSKRHLVKNYLECFNLKDDSDLHYLEKEGKKYPILDIYVVFTSSLIFFLLKHARSQFLKDPIL